jgi:hypothetical protein
MDLTVLNLVRAAARVVADGTQFVVGVVLSKPPLSTEWDHRWRKDLERLEAAIDAIEAADSPTALPSPDEKVWGIFVSGWHKDAILPAADSPKWQRGVGYKDVSFSRTWRGTKDEAQKLCDEVNADPARRLLGNVREVRPIPESERTP